MNPVLLATLRRHWQLIGTIAAFAIFMYVHLVFFKPTAARYRAAIKNAGGLETVFETNVMQTALPPRVYALATDNTLDAQDAQDRGGSGALGVILLEDLGRIAERSGLSVASSEPGPVTQEPLTAEIRAHLKLRGSYAQIVGFFDELSRVGSLNLVERFQIIPSGPNSDLLEVWIARLYLKQSRNGS
ncbi:MAG TPA: hypothetical protein VMJ70_08020 [Candidatus Sulfotelmatobacter sp.]|nr:hypothetical protein [Candidatus Sulfotelmatobacter sp.]